MTLDVTIGEIVPDTDNIEEDPKARYWVKQAPEANFDVCNPEYTMDAKEAYRSGSTGFWNFWLKKSEQLTEIYEAMRSNPNSNNRDVAYLKPLLTRINAIPESDFSSGIDLDRLKWFKYWANKAVELYGDKAGIMFT